MPTIDVKPFKPTSNADILNAIRADASPDYQRRVPEATKAGIQDNLQKLHEYRPGWNEFIEALINRIGLVIVKNNIWTNPLAKFKRGMLQYGDTIEEINIGLIKSKVYNADREYLEKDIFGTNRPDVQTSFHKLNRAEYYPITVNEPLLQRAFLEDNGLQKFVTGVMTAPVTSDNWDEFLQTTSLFREFYRAGGFFKIQVDDVTNVDASAPEARNFLRAVRSTASTLSFISTHYNPAGMPVAADPGELELFITPEALAAIDVEALAAAFHQDKADMPMRYTVIPKEHFGIPGVQAVLTTRDFFVIADSRIENTGIWNPVALQNNFFLHHWEVISASRFVPAILFTTEDGDVIVVDDTPVVSVSEITVTDEDGVTVTEVERGSLYQIVGSAVTDPAGGLNDAVRLEITGNLSSHTYVTTSGVLHVASDDESVSITVNAYAVDTDIPQLTASVTVSIVGDLLTIWPQPSVTPDEDLDSLLEVTPEDIVMDEDNNVTIPSVTGVQYKKDGANVTNGSVHNITVDTTFTAVARTNYELAAGATASWVIDIP